MSKPFLVIGLPRSRTAWFSIAATTGKAICYHEPTAHLGSFTDLRALWNDERFEHVGIADSSLVLQLPRIMAEIEPRTLIVSRDPAEVVASLNAYFDGSGVIPTPAVMEQIFLGASILEGYRHNPRVRWLGYDEAADVSEVSAALRWLIPGETFPKLTELMHMNVQVDLDWVISEARKPHTNWHTDVTH